MISKREMERTEKEKICLHKGESRKWDKMHRDEIENVFFFFFTIIEQ